jgi:YVTN family beta-propeller protein
VHKNYVWENVYELISILSFDLAPNRHLKNEGNSIVVSFFFISIFLVLLFLFSSVLQLSFADSVISTIQLGGRPDATGTQDEIAFNLNNSNAYVVNPAFGIAGGISAIDTQNNTVTGNITIHDFPNRLIRIPAEIALNPDNDSLYVSSLTLLVDFGTGTVIERCSDEGSSTPCFVSVIDTQNNTVIENIPVGEGFLPSAIAFNPDNDTAYVVNEKTLSRQTTLLSERLRNVSVIDTQNNTVIENIPVGNFTLDDIPTEIAFNPDNRDMYVINEGSETVVAGNGSISVIDTQNNTVIENIPVGVLPSAIAFNPDNDTAYVVNQESKTVSVIDTQNNTVIENIPVGNFPTDIAFNPDNRDMYVAGGFSNSVFVIDTQNNTVIENIPVGNVTNDIAYNPDNGKMYVTVGFSDHVSVIDTQNNTVIENIPVGEGALRIAYNPNNGNMYVTNVLDNTISVIETVPSQRALP